MPDRAEVELSLVEGDELNMNSISLAAACGRRLWLRLEQIC